MVTAKALHLSGAGIDDVEEAAPDRYRPEAWLILHGAQAYQAEVAGC